MKKKPVPPVDLWSQLDRVRENVKSAVKPENGFTIHDWKNRYGISRHKAARELSELEESGKIKCHRENYISGPLYYTFVKQ